MSDHWPSVVAATSADGASPELPVGESSSAGSASAVAASSTTPLAKQAAVRRSPDVRPGLHLFLLLLSLASVLYFCLLAERPLVSQGVYIDENSLLVGSAAPRLQDAALTKQLDLLERSRRDSPSAREWLLRELGTLPVSISESFFAHNDSLISTPEEDALGATSVLSAHWRAPKGDGKECFVLTAEFDQAPLGQLPPGSEHAISAVSILVAMARHLSTESGWRYFHKDLLFVFVGSHAAAAFSSPAISPFAIKARSVEAFGAWMDAYKSGQQASVERGGSIMATFALDIPTGMAYLSFSLDVLGFRGIVPNLDTPSMFLRAFERFGVNLLVAESAALELGEDAAQRSARLEPDDPAPFLRKAFYSASTPNERPGSWAVPAPLSDLFVGGRFDTNLVRWKGLWRFLLQALQGGAPSSGAYHAHALKYSIDAATVRAVPMRRGASPSKRDSLRLAVQTAQSLETVLRSSNNLAEKLHHSTYFYILNNTADFVTMSKYIYVAVLALAAWTVYAVALLLVCTTMGPLHFAHAFRILAAIYAACAAAYFAAGPLTHTVGQGKWNDEAKAAWAAFVLVEVLALIFVIVPLLSLLRRHRQAPGATSHDAPGIELLRVPAVPSKKETAKVAAHGPLQVWQELALSPPYLPLLPVSLWSSLPRWRCSLDWRAVQALVYLAATMALVPIMVLHFAACLLTLATTAPLVLASSATVWPTRWWTAVRALRDEQGKPLVLNTSLMWEVVKYVLRRSVHLLALAVFSPASLVWLYARFHGLPLLEAGSSMVTGLPLANSNVLFYTGAFVYAPIYILSLLQLTCTFTLEAASQPSEGKKRQ